MVGAIRFATLMHIHKNVYVNRYVYICIQNVEVSRREEKDLPFIFHFLFRKVAEYLFRD